MKVNISFGDDENITQMEKKTMRKMAPRAEGFDTGTASSNNNDSEDSAPDIVRKK